MDASLFSSRRPNPLAFLPLETRQKLVDSLYDPHHVFNLHRSVRYGSITLMLSSLTSIRQPQELVTVTVGEIIELCPPSRSVARYIDLTAPPFWPIWVCRGDGKQVLVWSEEELKRELARKPQCYGPTPDGPWYGDAADPWPFPWKQGRGLFAPYPLVLDRLVVFVEKEHVVAMCPLIFEYAHVRGEVFHLDDPLTRAAWSKAGYIMPLEKPSDLLYIPSTRVFVHERYMSDYEDMYKNDDITVFMSQDIPVFGRPDFVASRVEDEEWRAPVPVVQDDLPLADMALTPAPDEVQQAERTRRKRRKQGYKYGDKTFFLDILEYVVDLFRWKRHEDPGDREICYTIQWCDKNLWPDNLSPGTLRKLLSPERHNIELDAWLAKRDWPTECPAEPSCLLR